MTLLTTGAAGEIYNALDDTYGTPTNVIANDTNYWQSSRTSGTGSFIIGLSGKAIVTGLDIKSRAGSDTRLPASPTLYGSNDGVTWAAIAENLAVQAVSTLQTFTFSNSVAYVYYKLTWAATLDAGIYDAIQYLALNGTDQSLPNTVLNVSGDTYTANNQAYGNASNAGDGNTTTYWQGGEVSTGWFKIQLGTAGVANSIIAYPRSGAIGYFPVVATVQGSNNNSDWTTIPHTSNAFYANYPFWFLIGLTNITSYSYYKINFTSTVTGSNYAAISEIQLISVASAEKNVSVYDTVTVSESITVQLTSDAPIEISVYDSSSLAASVTCATSTVADITVSSYTAVGLIENTGCSVSSVPDTEVSIFDTILLNESALWATGSATEISISVISPISVIENCDVFVEVIDYLYLQDSVSVTDVVGVKVSDLLTSVVDTVTLTEQMTGKIDVLVGVVDGVTASESVSLILPVLNISTFDVAGIIEYTLFGGIEVRAAVVDAVVVEDFVTTVVAAAASLIQINLSESVSANEYAYSVTGELNISVLSSIVVYEFVRPKFIVSYGVLILDADILVPILDVEIICPQINTLILLPTLDAEVC